MSELWRHHPEDERFCPNCRVPLVRADGGDAAPPPEAIERHERARKIKPQLAEGPLVRVAGARNQAEGEFIQGLLLEEGVPSMLRRSAGFDVPDFLAAGPRDVMVPQSGLPAAREILLQAELISENAGAATGCTGSGCSWGYSSRSRSARSLCGSGSSYPALSAGAWERCRSAQSRPPRRGSVETLPSQAPFLEPDSRLGGKIRRQAQTALAIRARCERHAPSVWTNARPPNAF